MLNNKGDSETCDLAVKTCKVLTHVNVTYRYDNDLGQSEIKIESRREDLQFTLPTYVLQIYQTKI
jgi:hypothetical protein